MTYILFSALPDDTENGFTKTSPSLVDVARIDSISVSKHRAYVNYGARSAQILGNDLVLFGRALEHIKARAAWQDTFLWDDIIATMQDKQESKVKASREFKDFHYFFYYGMPQDVLKYLVDLVEPGSENPEILAAIETATRSIVPPGSAAAFLKALANRQDFYDNSEALVQTRLARYDFASPYNSIYNKLAEELQKIAGSHWPAPVATK